MFFLGKISRKTLRPTILSNFSFIQSWRFESSLTFFFWSKMHFEWTGLGLKQRFPIIYVSHSRTHVCDEWIVQLLNDIEGQRKINDQKNWQNINKNYFFLLSLPVSIWFIYWHLQLDDSVDYRAPLFSLKNFEKIPKFSRIFLSCNGAALLLSVMFFSFFSITTDRFIFVNSARWNSACTCFSIESIDLNN